MTMQYSVGLYGMCRENHSLSTPFKMSMGKKGVEIPKKNGKKRLLGIPTIEDRVAQMLLRNRLEPMLEPIKSFESP